MTFYLDLEVVERDLDLRRDRRDLDLDEELLEEEVDLDLFLRPFLLLFLRPRLDTDDLELVRTQNAYQ